MWFQVTLKAETWRWEEMGRENIRQQKGMWGSGNKCRRRQEEALHTHWTFFTTDCGSQWHMKYERQQHSPLFIGLQERKRKTEKAATPHILQGRVASFFYSLKRNCAQFSGCTYATAMASDRPVRFKYNSCTNPFRSLCIHWLSPFSFNSQS